MEIIDTIELPPQNLIAHVNGGYDPNDGWYNLGGYTLALNLCLAIEKYCNKKIQSYNNILDFGVGCNRVLGRIPSIHSSLTGIDIDADVIEYNSKTFKGKYFVNNSLPPLGVQDNTYDLIWSFSVFSHLPIDLAKSWIKELHRITQIGGNIIITTHLENMSSWHIKSDDSKQKYTQNGYIEDKYTCTITKTLTDNKNYINTFYTTDFFCKEILQGLFTILYVSNGANPLEFIKDDTDIEIINKIKKLNVPTHQEFIILEKK